MVEPYTLPGGVFCELAGRDDGCELLKPLEVPMGGNREGTVPARPRRVEFAAPWLDGARPVCAVLASKSGKLSLPGDSGMISRRGVEWPLPAGGGPHKDGEMPS